MMFRLQHSVGAHTRLWETFEPYSMTTRVLRDLQRAGRLVVTTNSVSPHGQPVFSPVPAPSISASVRIVCPACGVSRTPTLRCAFRQETSPSYDEHRPEASRACYEHRFRCASPARDCTFGHLSHLHSCCPDGSCAFYPLTAFSSKPWVFSPLPYCNIFYRRCRTPPFSFPCPRSYACYLSLNFGHGGMRVQPFCPA